MVWDPEALEGDEAGKVKWRVVPYTRGIGLDLGCGPWKVAPHAIGVDNFAEWDGLKWRPDVICDVTDLRFFADRSMDFVFSSHLLEHLEDTEAALREWWRVIKPGGYLILYLPHADLYPNIGEEGANPDHKHDFIPSDIEKRMRAFAGFDLVVDEARDQGEEYSFLQVYQKLSGTRSHRSCDKHNRDNVGKRALVIRYGGIGDMIMASSILPGLKEQGYHVTFNTTPSGHDILKADPHIDAFWIQDRNQVPNEHLGDYWKAIGAEFDKVVNLSESIEGALLALPDRRNHALSKEARGLLMGNVGYLDFTHAIADVPLPPRQKFYPTEAEIRQARNYRQMAPLSPLITWALAGSSVHKVWPWLHVAIESVLLQSEAQILLVGDKRSMALEHAVLQQIAMRHRGMSYEDSDAQEPGALRETLAKALPWLRRLRLGCGRQTVRESLAAACMSDIVIGPETGILNGVGLEEKVHKIVMLSHSSPQNLVRWWPNTTIVEPDDVPCYPCHRLHYGRDFCPEHKETGTALCAASIRPEVIVSAVMAKLPFLSLDRAG